VVESSAFISQETTEYNEEQILPLELEEEKKADWSVYPNPFTNTLLIKQHVDGQSLGQIRIYNLLGVLVWQKVSTQSIEELDLSGLEQGIYLIQLGGKGQQVIKMN
jgi:hypothetical protein